MSHEQEQQIMQTARHILAPEMYDEFIENYINNMNSGVSISYAVNNDLENTSKCVFSNYLLSECSEEEQNRFWTNTDQAVRMTVIQDVYQKTGEVYKISDIVKKMTTPEFMALDKMSRPMIFSTSDGFRPQGEQSIALWNGFQVIDLDIKDADLASQLQAELFECLKREPWFLASVVSSSGKGLHIWTKIAVPEGLTIKQLKILFALNFRHKYSAVYINIEKKHKELTPEQIVGFMDLSMFKPQQGVFIPGKQPFINANFKNLPIRFESLNDETRVYSDQEWVTAKALKETFSKWEWFAEYNTDPKDVIEPKQIISTSGYNLNGIKVHYKHAQRWQLANTLCSIYGFEESMKLLRAIVSDDVPTQELRADLLTANNHDKPISLWAVKTLNVVHGFNIKVDGNNVSIGQPRHKVNQDKIYDLWQERGKNAVDLTIKPGQYLSDITDEIKQALGHITVLEAGAGFGKTEMIKRLGGKVILVLPFTSIIESKFNDSPEWECFFQGRTVDKTDLELYDKLCMTIDKFAKLTMMDVNFSYFDYIVIDESHLLYLSEYRPVMARAIDNLAHSTSKVILMTGTTSGEIVFFPNAKHICVLKDETRDKTFTVRWGNNRKDTRIQMASAMADAIIENKKILYPTNAGSTCYETLIADINRFLFYKGFHRSVKSIYYKKANEGSPEMDTITFDKTIQDLDFVACTSYLSVGVDICDKYDFEIFFDKLLIAQDIEQYANRLRNNNLHIFMYLPKYDEDNNPYDYTTVLPLSLELDERELALARDSVKMCNALTLRAKGEYRYNPIIQSILQTDKYIRFSDDLGMYYVDETAYKLHTFESSYRYYAAQLPVVMQAMEQYGYKVSDTDKLAFAVQAEVAAEIESLNNDIRRTKYERETIETFSFLRAVSEDNIDYLLEALTGRFHIRKNELMDKPFILQDNTLYLRDVELFNKNMPMIKAFYRYYDLETIICIFDFCMGDKSRRINYSMLKRIAKLVSIEFNRRKGRVDVPVLKFMKDIREWVEENEYRSDVEISEFIKQSTIKYVSESGEFLLANVDLVDHTKDMVEDLFKVFVTKSKKDGKTGLCQLTVNKLLWSRKADFTQIYGNPNTKIFFIGDILEAGQQSANAAPEEEPIVIPEETSIEIDKSTLDPSIINKGYDYFNYASGNNIITGVYMRQAEKYAYGYDQEEINVEDNKEPLLETPRTLFDDV